MYIGTYMCRPARLSFVLPISCFLSGSASAWAAVLTSQCLLAQNNFRCVFLVFSLLFSLIVRNLMHLIFAFSH